MRAEGYKFIRYADDFVVMCKTMKQAESALNFVTHVIEQELGLQLSKEKTKISKAKDGFDFLGFHINSYGVSMREKSIEKFKTKIRMITTRSHNLNQEVVTKLKQVLRGTINYFTTPFTVMKPIIKLDQWIRKRIRCMKLKRISRKDNFRVKNKLIDRLGVPRCINIYVALKEKMQRSQPWATVFGVAQAGKLHLGK
jgi:RNA-directed DNA polymerase